jgi:hypothetical protein
MERHLIEARNRGTNNATKEVVGDLRRMHQLSSRALLKEARARLVGPMTSPFYLIGQHQTTQTMRFLRLYQWARNYHKVKL